jgi:hypothetical protein
MLKDHGQKSNLHTIITTLQEKACNRRNTLPREKKRPATDKHLKVEAIGDGSCNFCPFLRGADRPMFRTISLKKMGLMIWLGA